jgi:hypothetical protein
MQFKIIPLFLAEKIDNRRSSLVVNHLSLPTVNSFVLFQGKLKWLKLRGQVHGLNKRTKESLNVVVSH